MQKFKRGQRVKINDMLPPQMSHFESGCEAIVRYTYAERYGGDDHESYSLFILTDPSERLLNLETGKWETGREGHEVSWYEEEHLTLVNPDIKEGLEILERNKSYG